MDNEYEQPYEPDDERDANPSAGPAKPCTTFVMESRALDQLVFELDKTTPSELIAGDRFESRLCQYVSAQVDKYSLPPKQRGLIEALSGGVGRVTKDTAKALALLLIVQERDVSLFGSEVAYTEMLMGICYERLRMTDEAVKSLRNALTRFQQSDDDTIGSVMIESLCRLSEIYRAEDKKDSARATMKQASRLLPFVQGNWNCHYRLLAEMAAVLATTCNYEAAITAYKRVLKAKSECGRKNERSTIDVLIRLAIIYHTLHQLDEAEHALICAGVIYQELAEPDESQFVEIVQKLSGVLFEQGHFRQADFLSERANQIIGRAGTGPSYALLGDIMSKAAYQREQGNHAETKKLYRAALAALEAQREERLIDRLPILAGIFLLTSDKQELQRTSLLADMEVSLNQFFWRQEMPLREGIMKVAWMYGFVGYHSAANDLKSVADRIAHPPSLGLNSNNKISMNKGIVDSTELTIIPKGQMARLTMNS